MEFRIADTFTTSLARLNGGEQKAVKTTAFDLQLNLSNPGLHFHRLDRPRDPNFWSVRVNDDIRLIVHRTATSLLLCYVGHHDAAYAWAERRRIERHPTTGAAQLVELPQRIDHVAIPAVATTAPEPKPLLFGGITDETLLGYGVPPDWLDQVKEANEDTLFDIADHLPREASEALLTLATGGTPEIPMVPAHLPGVALSIDPATFLAADFSIERANFLAATDPFNHQTRSVGSGQSPVSRNWKEHSITHGTNGRFSCIPPNVGSSSSTTAARPG